MAELHYFVYPTPLGRLSIASNGDAITQIVFGLHKLADKNCASSLTNRAANQLQEYLAGKRQSFDVPLLAQGTAFQQAVWEEVLRIPYGETRSYGQIAQAIGNPNATRAVGMANNKNPIPIVIPCHRVVGADGKPGGYLAGPKIKLYLLRLEASHK